MGDAQKRSWCEFGVKLKISFSHLNASHVATYKAVFVQGLLI